MIGLAIKTLILLMAASLWSYFASCMWSWGFAPEYWMRALSQLLAIYSFLIASVVSLIGALWWRKL